jgi:hypothetical protein
MDYKEIVDKLTERGLDLSKATRIESLSGDQLIDYNPASDIANLFPVCMAAAINDLNSLENADRKVDIFASEILNSLCTKAFDTREGFDFEAELLKILKRIKKAYPDFYAKFTSKFFVNAMLSYFVANKFGARSCPVTSGRGYFNYFALLDIWDDLEPETQDLLIRDMAKKHLWDVTEDDIDEDI